MVRLRLVRFANANWRRAESHDHRRDHLKELIEKGPTVQKLATWTPDWSAPPRVDRVRLRI